MGVRYDFYVLFDYTGTEPCRMKIGAKWCARQESNLYLGFRRPS